MVFEEGKKYDDGMCEGKNRKGMQRNETQWQRMDGSDGGWVGIEEEGYWEVGIFYDRNRKW